MIPVYSISKPFLAQAVLELGLGLETAIGDHLANLSQVYATRTLGALLNHTSGLLDYGDLKEYHQAVAASELAWSRKELFERCLQLPHKTESSARFQYSNIGYLLLRMLVENATNQSYFNALNSLVFEPLGIGEVAEWESTGTLVPGYDPRWVYSGTFLANPEAIGPALAALARHRQETLGLAEGVLPVPYTNTGFEQPGYGYGFMGNGNPPSVVGHGGGGPGFELMALVCTDDWRSAVEYSQTGGFNQAEAIGRLRAELGC